MTQPTILELKEQLAIDKSVLDDEVIRQPVLFYTVSEQLTEAIAERDGAKEDLTSIDATLDAKWRKKLEGASKRVTNDHIASLVQTDPAHTKAFDVWLEAKTRADQLQALKEAFMQRSYMLRDLVSLYSANYYEEASVRPSKAQEVSHYAANRQRMSNARVARGK